MAGLYDTPTNAGPRTTGLPQTPNQGGYQYDPRTGTYGQLPPPTTNYDEFTGAVTTPSEMTAGANRQTVAAGRNNALMGLYNAANSQAFQENFSANAQE